jgi:hypothetical protein
VFDRDVPDSGVLVEHDPGDVVTEAKVLVQSELRGHRLDIAENFPTARVGVRPIRVRCETVGVQSRRNIARRTGIGVVAPGSTDRGAAFEDREITDSLLFQANRGADTGESAADNGDIQRLHGFLRHAAGS